MEAELEVIRDTWSDRETRDDARELAKQYLATHPDLVESFAGLSQEAFVAYVELARADGDDEAVWRANTWSISQQPVRIVGYGNVNGAWR